MAQTSLFKNGDYVVYPAHGVGQVQALERQKVAGFEVELLVISFEHERMTIRVPVAKAQTAGIRSLSTQNEMKSALTILKQKGKMKRAMWPRRAQELEAKINTGTPASLAEVLRDLYRNDEQTEQSYSERQIYLSALNRLARELALVEKIDSDKALVQLESALQKK